MEIFEKGVSYLRKALDEKRISSQELVEYFLNRIEKYDTSGPCINSVVCVDSNALQRASQLDAELSDNGPRSPLHGIPIVVKDNFDTCDMPTTASCATLRNSRPAADAFLVKRLRDAGAIVLAKTNLTEFARNGLTVGSLQGQTINPYDYSRTPGGSSGGTGAALASNFAVAGLGTDTVNSIRSPSSANSLVGLRPTTGLLSRTGIVPCTFTQDTGGPLARSVEDVAYILDICAGYDPNDSKTSEQLTFRSARYAVDAVPPRKWRIGVLRTNFGSDSDVLTASNNCLRALLDLGAELVDLDIPELASSSVFSNCDVQLYETKGTLDAYFATVPNCPVKNLVDLVSRGELHKSVFSDMEACSRLENPLSSPEYMQKIIAGLRLREKVFAEMGRHKLDFLCYPHQQILVEPIANGTQNGRNGILASVIGFPALTVPGGFSAPSAKAPLGVPIGFEFLARPYRENDLLSIGYAFEQATHFRKPPAL